jgi:hypothetical protein
MERLRTVATFVAGVIVGAGAVSMSPMQQPQVGPGMPSPVPGMPGGDLGMPPVAGPGSAPPGPTADPGTIGQPGGPPPGAAPAFVPDPAADVPGGRGTPEGPPLPTGEAVEPGQRPPPGGSRLEAHVRAAPVAWRQVLDAARRSRAASSMVGEVEAHIATIPAEGARMPPVSEVGAYLANSKLLLDRLSTKGVDVTDLALDVESLLRPPQGIPKTAPPSP